ncbi:unnamed protein product [Gongylonema pulchrum]|uniref:Uncharacterized protein n=1 Tax=Gongylonema pulchrum TaxID=637853 RepID=A0A3P6Q7M8_9BILA|nr:unnamed protein product [Gongylonema pulchrum]
MIDLHLTLLRKLAFKSARVEVWEKYLLKFCSLVPSLEIRLQLLNSCSASDLRLLPVGYDKDGLAYWYQQDADLVIRVYSAEQDDQSGGSWNLVAKYGRKKNWKA